MKLRYSLLFIRLKEFFSLWMCYGLRYSLYNMIWWFVFYCRIPYSYKISRFAIKKKTDWMDHYIEKRYSDIIKEYTQSNIQLHKTSKFYIWVYWGQGESEMPLLVKSCFNQLCSFHDNVVLITNENIKNYIEIPSTISKKLYEGKIGWANYSDIIRNTLLAKYGGLWLDSTVWITAKLPFDKLFTSAFYSANGKVKVTNKSICFWTSFESNWSSWCMGSEYINYPLFGFVSHMMQAMAVNEKCWPDYVIQDYLIFYAYRFIPCIKDDMLNISIHNEHRNELASLMNEPYDNFIYSQLCQTDSIFKLSYKSNYVCRTSDCNLTFFGKLIARI